MQKQIIPKPMLQDAIQDGHFEQYGSSDQMSPVDDQFKKYVYPIPGCSEIHMVWSDTPCFTTCWNDSNTLHEAYHNPKIETIVIQHQWMENDCSFADLLLPINTKFEEDDIGTDGIANHYDTLFLENKCIEPILYFVLHIAQNSTERLQYIPTSKSVVFQICRYYINTYM